jgi:hypothetical protein
MMFYDATRGGYLPEFKVLHKLEGREVDIAAWVNSRFRVERNPSAGQTGKFVFVRQSSFSPPM